MAQRNERDRRYERSYRDADYAGSRQAEQFQDNESDMLSDYDQRERRQDDQMGGGSRPGGFYYEEVTVYPPRSRSGRSRRGQREMSRFEDRDYSDRGSDYYAGAGSRYSNRPTRGFQSFADEDRYGDDFARGGRAPSYGRDSYGSYGRGSYGAQQYGRSGYGMRGGYDERDERGFFERAGDEIASWFGDEDAARRRRMDHRGRGPGNYTRSDERILEDACDNLTDDWQVDARNIQVTVKDGEVTLDGTVDDRTAKRRAEDCVETISGVKHVQNNLRVQASDRDYGAADSPMES